ncbi:MAG TPA: DUF882 domain-containing protein [Kofleriaceae bacterium]|nr:DUF882 domain-containing protein [Kofleriaceae bacterium]
MKLAIAVGVLLAMTATAAADAAYQAKKDRERAAKSTTHPAPPPVGAKPAKLINLQNRWTHDWLAVDPLRPPSVAEMDTFLRCHFTNEATQMEPKLIPTVVAAAKQFKMDVVYVISGFRHPKYNLMLRKKGHQVARDSQHTHGNAIDFTFPGMTLDQLHRLHAWVKSRRLGGVGIYPSSKFVHMDTGPVRFWTGD